MSRKVFISFRFSDGIQYKEQMSKVFDSADNIINCSEDQDRSNQNEETIKNYLYQKLKGTSVTIIIITPNAINYKKDFFGNIDDWMYDEVRYSLEDRENNRSNGIVAVYTPDAKQLLIKQDILSNSIYVKDLENLFRKNMMNIKPQYKKCKTNNQFDRDYDSYCSLVSFEEFCNDPYKFIQIAEAKRENIYKYDIKKRIESSHWF